MHKDSLLSKNITVRRAEIQDIAQIQSYILDLDNQQ
jgi:hypothetical protein